MRLFIAFYLFLFEEIATTSSTIATWDQFCPKICQCQIIFWTELQNETKTVSCTNLSLSQIPSNISSDTEALVLNHNTLGHSFQLNLIDLLHIKNLKLIDFSFNRFRILRNTAGTLENVIHLNLSHNSLQRLDHGAFRNFPNVRYLNLRHNKIFLISPLALELSNLEALDISHNRLTALQSTYFSGLTNLKILLLKRNNLGKITEPILHHLGELDLLDLSENRLTKIDSDAFSYIKAIKYLDLTSNHFLQTPKEAFTKLSYIKTITLNKNLFKIIHSQSFLGINVSNIVLCQNNELNFIEKQAFVNISIEKLVVTHNKNLMYIESGAFDNLPYLKSINLEHNGLLALPDHIFVGVPKLSELALQGNPLWCTCTIKWLQNILKNQSNAIQIKNKSNVTCSEEDSNPMPLLSLPDLPSRCVPMILPLFETHVETFPGQNFSARCIADGIPNPDTRWSSYSHEEIGCENRSCVVNNILTIKYAHKEDNGFYVCSADNELGNDSRKVELSVRDLNIHIVPLAVASTFVTLSWNYSSGAISEYLLQYRQLGEYKFHSKTISMGLKGHSYTLSGLRPGESYVIWLCLQKDEFVIRQSSIIVTTKDEGFLLMLGIETNYLSLGLVFVVIGIMFSSCFIMCVIRLCRWKTRKHNEMVLTDSASQRCFSNSSSASSGLAFMTFINFADEAALVENDYDSYEKICFGTRFEKNL